MSDTPRVDMALYFAGTMTNDRVVALEKLSRQLECELNEAQSLVAEITHGITHSPYCSESLPCIRCERDSLRTELNEAKRELIEAGWTHEPGAPRWKPPVNHEMGKLWNRLFEAERERDEAREKLAGKVHAGEVCIASRKYLDGIEKERDSLRAINAELENALEYLLDSNDWDIPAPNCCCHISPPCSDCVDFSGIREALKLARSSLTKSKQSSNG